MSRPSRGASRYGAATTRIGSRSRPASACARATPCAARSSSRATMTLPDGGTLRLDENSALGAPRAAVGTGLAGRAAARRHSCHQPRPAVVAVHDAVRQRRPRGNRVRHSRRRGRAAHGDRRARRRGRRDDARAASSVSASDHVARRARRRSADGVAVRGSRSSACAGRATTRRSSIGALPGARPGAAAVAAKRTPTSTRPCRGAPGDGAHRGRRSRHRRRHCASLRGTRRHCRSMPCSSLARGDRDAARALAGATRSPPSRAPSSRGSRCRTSSRAPVGSRPPSAPLREALALEPDNAIALTRLAELALARDDARTAIASATRARSLAPNAEHAARRARLRAACGRSTPPPPRAHSQPPSSSSRDAPLPRLGLGAGLDPARRPRRRAAAARARGRPRSGQPADAQLHGQDLRRRESRRADDEPARSRQATSIRSIRRLGSTRRCRNCAPIGPSRRCRICGWPRARTATGRFSARGCRSTRTSRRAAPGSAACTPSSASGGSRCSTRGRRVGDDPTNFAGHRLLADGYSTRAAARDRARQRAARFAAAAAGQRHADQAAARAAEPVPRAARGPEPRRRSTSSTSPVIANGLKLRASAVGGGNGTEGHDVSLGRASRPRLVQRRATTASRRTGSATTTTSSKSVANAFVQYRPSYDTNLQAELRSVRTEHGDLTDVLRSGRLLRLAARSTRTPTRCGSARSTG